VKKVKRAVQAIVDQVLNNESSLVGLTTLRDYDEYTFTHSVNVCIFSVALGRKLGLTKLQLYDLGMSALFHDVGKSRVPLEVLNKEGGLTEEEWRIMQCPPLARRSDAVRSARLRRDPLPRDGRRVRAPHEGRPDGVPQVDPRPHPVDLLEGHCSRRRVRRSDQPARLPDRADSAGSGPQRNVGESAPRVRTPVVVKAFINLIGIYPVGTCVILDTYEVALVHSANPDVAHVHRPVGASGDDKPDGGLLNPGTVVDLSEKTRADTSHAPSSRSPTRSNTVSTSAITLSENAIATRWRALGKSRALIPYLTAGFPHGRRLARRDAARGRSGCRFRRGRRALFGPARRRTGRFSVPTQAALEQGMTVPRVLELIRQAALGVPVIIMTYLNPVLAYGVQTLRQGSARCRSRGRGAHRPSCGRRSRSGAYRDEQLPRPDSAWSRRRLMTRDSKTALSGASGFVYLISRLGVDTERGRTSRPISTPRVQPRPGGEPFVRPLAGRGRLWHRQRRRKRPAAARVGGWRRGGERPDGTRWRKVAYSRDGAPHARARHGGATHEDRAVRRALQSGAGLGGYRRC